MGRNSEGSDLKGSLRLGQKHLVRNSHLGGRGGTSARKGGVKHQGGLRQRNWRPPPWIFGAKDRKDRKEWKAWVIDKERKMNTCIYICTYYMHIYFWLNIIGDIKCCRSRRQKMIALET